MWQGIAQNSWANAYSTCQVLGLTQELDDDVLQVTVRDGRWAKKDRPKTDEWGRGSHKNDAPLEPIHQLLLAGAPS